MVHAWGRESQRQPRREDEGSVGGCHGFLAGGGMHHDNTPSLFTLIRFAREMRREPERSEALLWAQLRGGRLGVRFRRQHPFAAGWIVDFYAASARLVVEVDLWSGVRVANVGCEAAVATEGGTSSNAAKRHTNKLPGEPFTQGAARLNAMRRGRPTASRRDVRRSLPPARGRLRPERDTFAAADHEVRQSARPVGRRSRRRRRRRRRARTRSRARRRLRRRRRLRARRLATACRFASEKRASQHIG